MDPKSLVLACQLTYQTVSQEQVHLRVIDRVDVRAHLAAPDAADDARDLGDLHQPPLHAQCRLFTCRCFILES
jgi:hypothetical protein